jgi:hypothetical protein
VLQKGLNFALTPQTVPKLEIIKSVEAAVLYLGPEGATEFKEIIKQAIENFKIKTSNISEHERKAIEDLKENTSIVISKADKGNVAVVLNKVDYEKKLGDLVNSVEYTKLKSNPSKSLETKVNKALEKSGEFEDKLRYRLAPKNCRAPHIYGLPKIHKDNVPLRPIVSCIGSPCQELAKYLVDILNPLFGKYPSFIKNSKKFVDEISGQYIDDRHILVSFDIVSLFTNTPVSEALKFVKTSLETDTSLIVRTQHSIPTLLELLSLCLNNTYFQWNDTFYSQTSGMAMGSPLSPVVCNIYLEIFEAEGIRDFPVKPVRYKRYMDDIFIEWPQHLCPITDFL